MTSASLPPLHHTLIDIYHTPLFAGHIFLSHSNSFDETVDIITKTAVLMVIQSYILYAHFLCH